MENTFDILIGKTVKAIYITDDDQQLWFDTNAGYYAFVTDNDCCNHVWFCYFNGVDKLPARVKSTKDYPWEKLTQGQFVMGDEAEDRVLFTLVTTKGNIDIEVRNSHNGYYGGSVKWMPKSTTMPNEVVQITNKGRDPILPPEDEESIDT